MEKQRWMDQISIEEITRGIRDVWGHEAPLTRCVIETRWAHVTPILGPKAQAIVRVRLPFALTATATILWNNVRWRVVSGPIEIPGNKVFAQFKMEIFE